MNILIPLENRGISGAYQDNLLWNEDKVYVMDNHRLALWCWFQKIQKNNRYNLLHIDAHPDLSDSALSDFTQDMWSISLQDFRNVWHEKTNTPLLRWDNYLKVFLKKYSDLVGETISATHKVGSHEELNREIKAYDLVKFSHNLFFEKNYFNDLPWIVNLDLDYFFSAAPEKLELFSDDYIHNIALSLKQGMSSGMISVLTISLSPECCGSWEKAERMLKKLDLIKF